MSADYRVYGNPYTTQAAGMHAAQLPGVWMSQGAYPPAQGGYQGMAPQYAAYPHYGHPAPQYYAAQQPSSSFFNFASDRFLKGLLIGAAATYLLTNESVQQAAIKGAVKAWTMVQGGVEELKERFQDAEAELRVAKAAEGE
jgi:hypothetical protein